MSTFLVDRTNYLVVGRHIVRVRETNYENDQTIYQRLTPIKEISDIFEVYVHTFIDSAQLVGLRDASCVRNNITGESTAEDTPSRRTLIKFMELGANHYRVIICRILIIRVSEDNDRDAWDVDCVQRRGYHCLG